jgi:beta-xylosidase
MAVERQLKSEWYSLSQHKNKLRLFAVQDESYLHNKNLWDVPSLLLQKPPAENFVVTTTFDTHKLQAGDSAGLIMYGLDYQWIGVKASSQGQQLVLMKCETADSNCQEQMLATVDIKQHNIQLRMSVREGGQAQFSYKLKGATFTEIGTPFTAARANGFI